METACKYAAYLSKQEEEIRGFAASEGLRLPIGAGEVDYMRVAGVSKEEGELLNRALPGTLGAAAALPHMRPAGLLALQRFALAWREGASKGPQ